MKYIVKISLVIIYLLLIFYLIIPSKSFPEAIPGSLQSNEPADVETSLRRAYFTDMSREEVLSYYQNQFEKFDFLGIKIPTLRLNYPPEEAQTLIRDQTRSTFLEEIVHPVRESLFINGFEPSEDKDTIVVDGKTWKQKVTVRFIPSNVYLRVFIGLLIIVTTEILLNEILNTIKKLKRNND